MALPYPTDPSLPANPSPVFSDSTAARGDHLRANNGEIWANFSHIYESLTGVNTDAESYILSLILNSPTIHTPTITEGSFINSSSYAVHAVASGADAIYGAASAASKAGVYGENSDAAGYGVQGYNSGSGNGVYGQSASGHSIYGYSETSGKAGVRGINNTTGYGVYGTGETYGVYGTSTSGYGVYGYTSGSYAVAGNTAYYNSSSKFLKYKESVSIIDMLKARPLQVYQYTWEDANSKSFGQFIGPMAEDVFKTFKLNKDKDGVAGIDGIALGLGIELLEKITILEEKIKILEAA